MKPRINRTPPLPSPSAVFLKDDVKFNRENSNSLTLIPPTDLIIYYEQTSIKR